MFTTAAVCLLGAPARASIDVDFNADGILDSVVLPHTPATSIVVHFSGAAPQILRFHDRIVSIVATDINHDGEIDLSALTERRGVFIWLNKGTGSTRKLKAVKRLPHKRGYSLTRRGPLAAPTGTTSDGPLSIGVQDDRDRSLHYESDFYQRSEQQTVGANRSPLPDVSAGLGPPFPSRAPPHPLTDRSAVRTDSEPDA